MLSGSVPASFRILKQGDLSGDNMSVFYCRECGFVELYKQPSTKEPWRWPEQHETLPKELPQQPKEKLPSTETSRKKMIR